MTALTRRKAISAIAAAPAAVAFPASGTDASELLRLIEQHKAVYHSFGEALDRLGELDSISFKTGRKPRGHAKADKECEGLGGEELQLLYEICGYRSRTLEEARIKAGYLLSTSFVRDMWDQEEKALLESFV